MKQYMVLFEQGENSVGAFIPELPGCVAVGDDLEEAKKLIKEAMDIHLASMEEDGDLIPDPTIIHAELVGVQIEQHG
jgi:predicted RNase H-like HicB family nuclease